MKKIKKYLFKLLFPKYHKALMVALDISYTYYSKSPDYSKREVGRDIWSQITKQF